MSDKISISGVRAHGKHGVFEQEKLVEQEFVVDVELKLDLQAAADTDDLAKTINYEDIAVMIHETITGPTVNLIETLAGRISNEILKNYSSVEKVKVTVHKPAAPISVPFGDVAVTIKRER
jgi:dihydroneopterin aldolase